MQRNKIKNILVLALSTSAMLLAGCDKVEAKLPTNNSILNITDSNGSAVDVYNNTEKEIYDALISSGDTNSEKVLNNVLYIYSQSIYGAFFGEDGLRAAATSKEDAKIDAFVEKYSAYQVEKKNEDGSVSIDLEKSRVRVKTLYKEFLYRINESFYGYVKDSSYQDRNQFFEEKFYKAQVKNYYKLGDNYSKEGALIDGSKRLDEDDIAQQEALLGEYFADIFATYENYIEINLLPDIYRKELTAQYLMDENYSSTIRNVAARKVDYITLPADSNNNVYRLIEAYDTKVIKEGLDNQYPLTFLDRLYKGVEEFSGEEATMANSIYDSANWTKLSITVGSDTVDYYKESQFGDICEKYKVIADASNRYDPNFETQWNSFTSSGTYAKETGFMIQSRELFAKNNTTNGWFTPGGLSSLPESLRNRIFKTQVANQIVSKISTYKNAYVEKPNDNGNYYLIPKDPLSSDPHKYIVKDGSNYTIVQVKEAAKSSAFDIDNKDDYYGDEKAYRVARKIAYSLASSDTWVKAAKNYYVEKMAIIYHDEYVLDYFKTTFPDLFD